MADYTSLLVAPIYERGAIRRTLDLPAGLWWDFWTKQPIEGGRNVTLTAALDSLPVLVKAGAIVPTGPVKQYAEEPTTEPVTLTVYPGDDGDFTFYDDDGLTFAYERNDFEEISMHWNNALRRLTLHPGKVFANNHDGSRCNWQVGKKR